MKKNQIVVAIYCRLSKEDMDKLDKGDDSESIQNQKLLLMDYAVQNNFIIYKVYADDDFGGFSDRPQFNQMIEDAQEGYFNTILCKHQSRFTRDMELVERYIHGLFIEWGIRFISLTDHVDTNVKGNKKARQINGLINEWYCEDLSENVRTVLRKKRENGQFLGSFACYGYMKDPKNKHKLIVDEEAATVVKDIYSMYLSGYGVQSIALSLTERGIVPPAKYKKEQGLNFANPNSSFFSEKHNAWAVNTVRRILRNETYIGNLVQGREHSISYKTKKLKATPKEDWVIVKGTHEAIIDKQSFYTVQKLIDNKRTGYTQSVKNHNVKPHLLAGKLICADCGGTLHRSGMSRDGSIRYMRCQLANKTKNRDCTPHTVSQQKVEEILLERINYIVEGTIQSDDGMEIVNEAFNKVSNTREQQAAKQKALEEIENKIKNLQKKVSLAYSDRLDGIITEADFIDFKKTFDEEKAIYIKRKEQIERELQEIEARLKTHSNINNLMEKYNRVDELTHEIVNDFVDSVVIGEKDPITNEQKITINWLF